MVAEEDFYFDGFSKGKGAFLKGLLKTTSPNRLGLAYILARLPFLAGPFSETMVPSYCDIKQEFRIQIRLAYSHPIRKMKRVLHPVCEARIRPRAHMR